MVLVKSIYLLTDRFLHSYTEDEERKTYLTILNTQVAKEEQYFRLLSIHPAGCTVV